MKKEPGTLKTVLNEDIEKLERGGSHRICRSLSVTLYEPFVIFFYLLSVNVELALISLIPLLFCNRNYGSDVCTYDEGYGQGK